MRVSQRSAFSSHLFVSSLQANENYKAGLYVSESVDGETVAKLRKLDLPYNDVLRTVRQRKANLVRRHIRIAEQYIEAVGLGKFPYRRGR